MQTVFVQWSASDVWSMTFIRWQRRLYPRPFVANKNGDGWVKGKRDKKGWWGIGAIVRFNLLDHKDGRRSSRNQGLPPLHTWLAPHTELYRTYQGARTHRGRTLKRPTMKEYLRLVRRRKKK